MAGFFECLKLSKEKKMTEAEKDLEILRLKAAINVFSSLSVTMMGLLVSTGKALSEIEKEIKEKKETLQKEKEGKK